jgi:glycosyltransferase involved in cell wall biosynthesis
VQETQSMRVLIDTTFAVRAPLSGTAVYIERLMAELARSGGVDLVAVANRRRRPPAGGGLGSARNLIADFWWTQLELPRLARRARADLVHHPLPARSLVSSLPQVVTVHDLAFERVPDLFDRGFRIYAHHSHRAAALSASAVVCVSETTAEAVRKLWGVSGERIVVALHGPGQYPAGELGNAARGIGAHFLYVGDDQPRKNLAALLAAYRVYRTTVNDPLDLVVAGSAAADGPGVRIERDPAANRLAELYASATALVHPSLYEGFGLTVLEAMSIGTPVLAARSPGVVEVGGAAVRYVEAGDPMSFAAAMAEIAEQPELRAQLSDRGRRRAAGFSWAASARAHLGAYSLALSR